MKHFTEWLGEIVAMTGITAIIYLVITGMAAGLRQNPQPWFPIISEGIRIYGLAWGAITLWITGFKLDDVKHDVDNWFRVWREQQYKLAELKAKAALPPPPDRFDLEAMKEVETISPQRIEQ